jgi:EmrB/QacA subfamily drug resistance transporter
VFTLASASCALAPNGGWLIASRAVQGVGAAMVLPVGVALISASFPAQRLGRAMGIYSGVAGLGTVAGPLLGGVITQTLGWEWIFWLNVPIGLIALPFVFVRIKETHGPDRALDLPGVALVAVAVLGLVWALVRGNSAGWTSPEVIGALVVGVAVAVAFVRWESRAPHPMLPMAFFRNRAFAAGNVVTFLLISEVFGSAFLMAQFLQTALGSGPLTSGLQLIPWNGTMMFIAPLAGSLADRYGVRPVTCAGLALTTIGMGWLALIAHPGASYAMIALPLLVIGIGNSAAIPVAQTAVVGALGPDAAGKASGVNGMLREIGGVFGIAIMASVFSGVGGYLSPRTFTEGFRAAIAVAAGAALLGAIAGSTLPGKGRSPAKSEATAGLASAWDRDTRPSATSTMTTTNTAIANTATATTTEDAS